MPDRPETALTPIPAHDASHALLTDAQQHKSYLQTGVDSALDATIGSQSTVGKEISRYAPSFLQTAALFTPGRGALVASMAIGAAGEMRVGDSLQMQIAEFGLGAAKGGATKYMFNKLGNANIMEGSLMSVPFRGVVLGASSRALDTGLSAHTWLNSQGNFDATQGLTRTLSTSLDPRSLALDGLIFGVAHGATSGINRISGGMLEKSQAARNIVMGTTFGVTGGASSEFIAQTQRGGPYNWGEIATRGLAQGAVDGLASAPGAFYGARLAAVEKNESSTNNKGNNSGGNGSGADHERANGDRTFAEKMSDAVDSAVDSADNLSRKAGVVAAIGLSALDAHSGNITAARSQQVESTQQQHVQYVEASAGDGSTSTVINYLDHIKLITPVPGERVVLPEGAALVKGAGTVDLRNNGIYHIEVPEGQTLRLVYKDGEPQVGISPNSKGTIEYVNQNDKELTPESFLTPDGGVRPDVSILHPLADVFTPDEIAKIMEIQQIHREVQQRQPEISQEEKQAIAEKTYVPAKVNGGVLHIVVGPPGAGKSTNIVNPLAEQYGATVIDGDAINPHIPGYENGLGQVAVGPVSAEIRAIQTKIAFAEKANTVLPFLGQKLPVVLEVINDARAAGYTKIAVHYVQVPNEVSARRVFGRSVAPPTEDGIRQVIDPEWALRRIKDNVGKVFDDIITRPGLIDEYAHYNGDVPRGEQFPVVRKSGGQ